MSNKRRPLPSEVDELLHKLVPKARQRHRIRRQLRKKRSFCDRHPRSWPFIFCCVEFDPEWTVFEAPTKFSLYDSSCWISEEWTANPKKHFFDCLLRRKFPITGLALTDEDNVQLAEHRLFDKLVRDHPELTFYQGMRSAIPHDDVSKDIFFEISHWTHVVLEYPTMMDAEYVVRLLQEPHLQKLALIQAGTSVLKTVGQAVASSHYLKKWPLTTSQFQVVEPFVRKNWSIVDGTPYAERNRLGRIDVWGGLGLVREIGRDVALIVLKKLVRVY